MFCRDFSLSELAADERLKSNSLRVKAREWLIPRLGEVFARYEEKALMRKLEAIGLPFAPIAKPWDLLQDPHLNASGGLVEVEVSGRTVHAPALPLALGGRRLAKRLDPPRIGEHGRELLAGLGCSPQEIEALAKRGIVVYQSTEEVEDGKRKG